MNIFNLITLLGGLAMFLYGMRMMGDGLKESSSGTLKNAMEKLTNKPIKAFLLGVATTAIIQSSTATIVITSGLVGAGIISLHQSLGIIIGANVGTTVTGQIIRLLDINASGTSILQLFKPSTLAPLALIIGIIMIMAPKFENADKVGKILIGFGILFSGLMNMTDAVSALNESGIIEGLFSRLGENPFIGYVIGAGVAFALQSSSATIGILQAFSTSGQLSFGAIYAVLLGIYLGDCVTTALVCNIGAKPEAKRVGVVNILFNLSETVTIFLAVTIIHKIGLLDGIWSSVITSGGIANTNTVFNLSCAIVLFPLLGIYEKISHKLVKDDETEQEMTLEDDRINALNPVFFSSPALAFARCYDLLLAMFDIASSNIRRAFDIIEKYDETTANLIFENEQILDAMTDKGSNYLVQLSGHIHSPYHMNIMNYYFTIFTEFERLGDHAVNIAETAVDLHKNETGFSEKALKELNVMEDILARLLDYSIKAFAKQNQKAARHIEPLEEVIDDMVSVLKGRHVERLRDGSCSIYTGTEFLNLLSDVERVSDICSNIGVATIARANPEMMNQMHDYVSTLHAGHDEEFNKEYKEAHDYYFNKMNILKQ